MPLGFSGGQSFAQQLGEFGRDSANLTLQTGAVITQGLHQMMTNRQVQGLGSELGQLNPASPEWAQQAVQLGSRYPLAMKSQAGQFMLGTQAKAHAEWAQAQRAEQQATAMMARQVGMENLRTNNDIKLEGIRQQNRLAAGEGGVDLANIPLPQSLGQQGMGISLGTDEQQPRPMQEISGSTPMTGMDGLLPDISQRALSPLRAAQLATGVKPTRSQVFSAISQEDRQLQQEKRDAERGVKSAAESASKVEETKRKEAVAAGVRKENAARAVQRGLLTQKRKETGTAISRARAALNKHLNAEKEREADDDEYFATKATLQGELERAGNEAAQLDQQIAALVDVTEAEESGKRLDKDTAAELLREARGDKEAARALARERGFTF